LAEKFQDTVENDENASFSVFESMVIGTLCDDSMTESVRTAEQLQLRAAWVPKHHQIDVGEVEILSLCASSVGKNGVACVYSSHCLFFGSSRPIIRAPIRMPPRDLMLNPRSIT
jgi:hypothetical protein